MCWICSKVLPSIVKVSSESGLTITQVNTSSDHCDDIITHTCYLAIDLNTTYYGVSYNISVASVSGVRTGPFSAQVKSIGE